MFAFQEILSVYLRRLYSKKELNLIDRVVVFLLKFAVEFRIAEKIRGQRASRIYINVRNLDRNFFSTKWTLYTIDQLVEDTLEWIKSFDVVYDAIVGIPRSGMLVADLIASKLGKPLSTPSQMMQGYYYRKGDLGFPSKASPLRRILLVDDSVISGRTLQKVGEELEKALPGVQIDCGALIVTKNTKELVDCYGRICPARQIYEWNLLVLKTGIIGMDMDGVICEDCPGISEFTETDYVHWMQTAKPYLIPDYKIDYIISNRLEKYRAVTEDWLRKHEVKFDRLILFPSHDMNDRIGHEAENKIKQLLKYKPEYFIESNVNEAEQMWKGTRIPTISIQIMKIFN